ncbi:MAG: GNAT family N-acetyltransferase [Nesterenkonia sp.]
MSPAAVTVRAAEPADYQRIADLTVAAYLNGGHMRPSDGYLQHLRQVADRAQRAQLLVAEVDSAVAGSVTVTDYDGDYAEVSRPGEMEFRMLATAPEHQGRGIGRHLIRHVVAAAGARPEISAVTLCSLASMKAAHRLYGSEGFVADPDRDFVLITPQTTGRFPFFRREVSARRPEAGQLAGAERT